jgi:2,3-bisphosphoglycerate-independent phosphoglycerate mutase
MGVDRNRLFIHAFTDGRDSPPNSGLQYLQEVERQLDSIGVGRIASVAGRFYAMDRDHRWQRVEAVYRLLTEGKGRQANSATEAVQYYYDHPTDDSRHGDEFIEPAVITNEYGEPLTRIKDGDSIIFFNFRGDRPRELVKAFVFDQFPYEEKGVTHGFDRPQKLDIELVTMTSYEHGLPVEVAFKEPERMQDILGAYLSRLGLRQFRCAETEKYPHVTFFFNDYREEPFEGEDRKIIPSPRDVPTYDLKPQMSAYEVTDEFIQRIRSEKYDAMILNYANGDMVGHSGNLDAAIKAVETVDECVGRVVDETLAAGGKLIVTADHGNCEQMIDPGTGHPHTAHTTYPVELIVVDPDRKGATLRRDGRLADVAPTILELMDLEQPPAMTGRSLLDQS